MKTRWRKTFIRRQGGDSMEKVKKKVERISGQETSGKLQGAVREESANFRGRRYDLGLI